MNGFLGRDKQSSLRPPGRVFTLIWVGFALLTVGCGSFEQAPAPPPVSDADGLIAFFREKISTSPMHYPSHALLSDALLRKARGGGGDPELLDEARTSALRSIEIQPNYIAVKTLAMIANYSHRFADALQWAEKAAAASPEGLERDSELTAIFVESYLGLGENEKAGAVLDRFSTIGKKPDDFHIAAARGGFLKATGKPDEAVKAFEKAEKFAALQNALDLVVWCISMQAGCMLDIGRAAEAEAFLNKGKGIAPDDKLLKIHLAEFLAATGRSEEALQIYELLLRTKDDPEMHHRAFLMARDLGRADLASTHFDASVKGFEKILATGEIYALGSLAQLYCDGGVELEKGNALAQRNLEYKRDAEAQRTAKCLADKLRAPAAS